MLVEWILYTAEATAITGEIKEREHTGMLRPRTRQGERREIQITPS
jgi:hypothetical protein